MDKTLEPSTRDALVDAVLDRLQDESSPKIQIINDEVPLGARVQANAPAGSPTTIIIFPNAPGSKFKIKGVRTFNKPDQVEILRISSDADLPLNAASFDCAAYALEHRTEKDPELHECRAYYSADWGIIDSRRPLTVTYAALGCPGSMPFLNIALYGRYVRDLPVGAQHTLPRAFVERLVDEVLALAPIPAQPLADPTTRAPETAPELEPRHAWGIPLGTMLRRR